MSSLLLWNICIIDLFNASLYSKDKNIESLETEEEDFEEIRKNTMKNKVILKEDSDNNSDDSKSSDNEAEV